MNSNPLIAGVLITHHSGGERGGGAERGGGEGEGGGGMGGGERRR